MDFILPFFHLCSNTSQQFAEVSDHFLLLELAFFACSFYSSFVFIF